MMLLLAPSSPVRMRMRLMLVARSPVLVRRVFGLALLHSSRRLSHRSCVLVLVLVPVLVLVLLRRTAAAPVRLVHHLLHRRLADHRLPARKYK
mgnify:CR=1 FL=1